ncbi:hypothetical protein K438DRAFT_1964832 [Mycena galopus ATCC 62051]|nr:hypothetical protein K438DRAFT_1964832 [Mycena galopus ATCC 62051]
MLTLTLRRILARYRRRRPLAPGADLNCAELVQIISHVDIHGCQRAVRELCSNHDIHSAVSNDAILSLLRPFSATQLKDDSPWRVLCDITGVGPGSECLLEVAFVLVVQLLALKRRSASLEVVQIHSSCSEMTASLSSFPTAGGTASGCVLRSTGRNSYRTGGNGASSACGNPQGD